MADAPVPPDVRRKQIRWAILQLVLGQAQMIGAVAGLYLLITTGVSEQTLAVCAVAGVCTLVSRLVFKGRRAADMVGTAGHKPPGDPDST